jgi:hypothetical protein
MKKILISLLILACSLPLMAQRQIELKELQPKAAEVIPVKVEMIDNQEVLTVSSYNHSIQIPLTAESKAEIDALLEAPVGASKRVKDISGAEVSIMKVTANMKPALYFRVQNKSSFSLGMEAIKEELQKWQMK